MKFAFYTLGCKTNQYETQAMERLLRDRGHEIGHFDEACQGYVVNTCSVTAVADKKNRAVIRRCRKTHPEAVIAVCGCYTQHDADAVRALGVDVIGGSGQRQAFVDMLVEAAEHKQNRSQSAPVSEAQGIGSVAWGEAEDCRVASLLAMPGDFESVDNALRRREFEVLPAGGLEERTRAMLKVQDGCVNFCAYCIIPYTRGPVRSAPLDVVVAQSRELARKGYREIVVTGIEIASWGVDLPGKPPMTDMLKAVCAAVPELRVRLGSLEPRVITREFCEEMAAFPNLCPQFHLSMQSGCDTVLSRMRRKYDTKRYLESVTLLKEFFPGCNLTTDMIVAFPGETEAEFRQSLEFIQKCGFGDMHIFPYSRRPGTPADKMPGQHDNATKESRSRAAIAVAEEMSRQYRQSLIGTTQAALFEEVADGYYVGHAPNYTKVYTLGKNLHNQVRNVVIQDTFRDGIRGTLA